MNAVPDFDTPIRTPIKSPYPYFGGKSAVAFEIWKRFGDVKNFIDPFFGSGAVLLARPHNPDLELVNDIDGLIVNFWRAVQAEPEQVAEYADYPAFESDLHARHAWLVGRKESLQERLEGDPDYYDPKIAGWWVWGMSLWIGSGFCSGNGSWIVEGGKLIKAERTDRAVARQLPYLSRSPVGVSSARIVGQSARLTANQGINSEAICGKLPRLTGFVGVKRNRLELSGSPKGVSRKRLHLMSQKGVQRGSLSGIFAYIDTLQQRFRRVRVTCGDWSRVVTPAVLGAKSPCAVLLDPPYVHEGRETNLYNTDDAALYAQVRQWAIENGNNPDLRIAYCGYEDGFQFPGTWEKFAWKANGGYSNQGEGRKENASKETIWFSPFCLQAELQKSLFDFTQEEPS